MFEKLYNLKNFVIRGEEHIVGVGSNAKMNEFSAIMGLCNLENLQDNVEARKQVVVNYSDRLQEISQVILPSFENRDIIYNYAYFPIRFEQENMRNAVYDKLKKHLFFQESIFIL